MNISWNRIEVELEVFKKWCFSSINRQNIQTRFRQLIAFSSRLLQVILMIFQRIQQYFKQQLIRFNILENRIESRSITIPSRPRSVNLRRREPVINPQLELDPYHIIIYEKLLSKYIYVGKAPPIKNLVIGGGGAKGVVLPGVFQAFDQYKVEPTISFRDQLENVAGSSIGAVNAALIASGMSGDDITKASKEVDFQDLLGEKYLWNEGKSLIKNIKKNMKESIQKHLKTIWKTKELKNLPLDRLIKESLDQSEKGYTQIQIEETIDNIQQLLKTLEQSDYERNDDLVCITFAMLEALHQLNPKIFKSLTITASCVERGEIFYFDSTRTPHLDVAIACRASASMPIILEKVEIQRELLLPGYQDKVGTARSLSFVDGGVIKNIPVSVMNDKQGKDLRNRGEANQNLQTLAVFFDVSNNNKDEQSPYHNVVTDPNLYTRSLTERIIDFSLPTLADIKMKRPYSYQKRKNLERLRKDYALRTIPLPVDLSTLDFQKAKENEGKYHLLGLRITMEYLANREKECLYRESSSLKDLFKYIPDSLRTEMQDKLIEFEQRCLGSRSVAS